MRIVSRLFINSRTVLRSLTSPSVARLSRSGYASSTFRAFSSAAVEAGRNDIDLVKKVNGQPYESVPKISVYGDFITAEEETALVAECQQLRQTFGFQSHKDLPVSARGGGAGGADAAAAHLNISAFRVTGRPEDSQKQVPAPWGYAKKFDAAHLPAHLSHLVQKVSLWSADLQVSQLRDVTINYRSNSMFKVDPHIDPADDGGHVLVLSLLSDVVFTLSPERQLLMSNPNMSPVIRTAPQAIELKSWSNEDVDVHLKRRAIVHMREDARYQWQHGIRTGLQVEGGGAVQGICDFWGSLDCLVPRSADRISVILAYD